ncbi:MAG: FkbM family methyltransferase [Pseudomonadota bacterium]
MPRPDTDPDLHFATPSARRHYRCLMALYRLAVNRYLYRLFARQLGRFFPEDSAVSLTLPSGGVFPVSLNDGYWTRFALFHTEYEPEVARILDVCTGHADTFCDLGANKGYWTAYAAPLFQTVISVEASSATFRILAENTRAITNVTRRWAAVFSESNLELTFRNVAGSHASGHLSQDARPDEVAETVETVAVDDLLRAGTAAVIKLDVEGAEREAIAGAQRAIADGSLIVYEDHGADSDCHSSAAMYDLGNVSVYFLGNTLQPMSNLTEVQAVKTDRFRGYNFLAARNDAPLLAQVRSGFAIS